MSHGKNRSRKVGEQPKWEEDFRKLFEGKNTVVWKKLNLPEYNDEWRVKSVEHKVLNKSENVNVFE